MYLTKEKLDELTKNYEVPEFIENDPVQFPHRFIKQEDIEISGLISSAFAYGSRPKIIETLEYIHKITGNAPSDFVKNFDMDRDSQLFRGFIYRYNQEKDLILLLYILGAALNEYQTLENAFLKGYKHEDKDIKQSLINFVNLLRNYLPCDEKNCRGLFHLIPTPELGSACKRLNLFLKWMVRKPPVDLGIWKTVSPSKLIIPLDTHVARISKKWGLTSRKTNDWKTAGEITQKLKQFDESDPVKYDFAIFGLGISGLE